MSYSLSDEGDYIAAIDVSFMSKAGKKTDGLGWFYNGGAGEAQRGLEISMKWFYECEQCKTLLKPKPGDAAFIAHMEQYLARPFKWIKKPE